MSGRIRIERGIFLTGSQRYEVKVQDRLGSTSTVSTTVDSLGDARNLVVEADKIRNGGGSVREHWECKVERDERRRVKTFREHAEAWMADRENLMQRSDHSRAGNHLGGRSLRPGTVKVETSQIQCHLIPALGDLPTTEIDLADVQRLVKEMASPKGPDGTAMKPETQMSVLKKLRQICSALPRAQQPQDFPWPTVQPESISKTRAPDPNPTRWAGKPGSKPPVVPYSGVKLLAGQITAALRCVLWIMAIMGLRRGETMGLHNTDFEVDGDWTWVNVERQMDLQTGELLRYTKSDASTRRLPIPPVLLYYLFMYWDRYHSGYRPGDHWHPRHHHQFTVTSTGRAPDGSFMAASPHPYATSLKAKRDDAGYGYEECGYMLRPHTARKIPSTYGLHRQQIITDIFGAPDPMPDGDDATIAQWARTQEQRITATEELSFTDADVSRWMGHEQRSSHERDDGTSASPVTLQYYGLGMNRVDNPFIAIAKFLDLVIRREIGSIEDKPDPRDTYLVVHPGDPDWVLVRDAAALTGKAEGTLTAGIRNGSYEGQLAWFADGERRPPGPRLMIHRTEIERITARQSSISKSQAARLLGLSNNYVDGAIRRGDLDVVERHPTLVYIDLASVERLQKRILQLVATIYPDSTSGDTVQHAHDRFRSCADDDPYELARRQLAAGATYAEAARMAQVNPDTLRSVARRNGWRSNNFEPDHSTATRTAVRRLFRRPKRVPLKLFTRWTEDAVACALLIRVNGTHMRRPQP